MSYSFPFKWNIGRLHELTMVAALMAGVLGSAYARADLITAKDAGFVTMMGGSAKGDGAVFSGATYNYSVGRELHYETGSYGPSLIPMDRNNYFVFDLSGVTETITSASLEVYAGEYESVDPSETFLLVAPVDPGAALGDAMSLLGSNMVGMSEFDEPTDPAISVAKALYGNIEGGPIVLGMAEISSAEDFTVLSIDFLPTGIDYLNSFLGGTVFIGGTVPTAVPPAFPQQPFGFTGPDIPGGDPLTPGLSIEVIPEPGAMGLAVVGLIGLLVKRRA